MLNFSKHLILINCDPVANPGFNSQQGKILLSLQNPDQPWYQHSLVTSGYHQQFLQSGADLLLWFIEGKALHPLSQVLLPSLNYVL
jgi:hypothetical protein